MASSNDEDLTVALVGDLNLGTPIKPDIVLDLIKKDFAAIDVKFFNLEGCLFNPNILLEHKPGCSSDRSLRRKTDFLQPG